MSLPPTARDAVLASVREALGPGRESGAGGTRTGYRTVGERDDEAVRSLFAERCRDYGTTVVTVAAEEVGEAIAATLAEAGIERVAVPADLPARWRTGPVEWIEDHGMEVAELDAVDGAVTGCAAAIAETGTVVLDSGPTQGRRILTLVPDFHLCIVDARRIFELVPEAMKELRASAAAGRPLTFVSGCSATSDIELERVSGVHGPRTLALLVLV